MKTIRFFLILAFSTHSAAKTASGEFSTNFLPNDRLDPVFRATVQATEEAVTNALIAATTMEGINGNTVYALPHDRLKEVLGQHGILKKEAH